MKFYQGVYFSCGTITNLIIFLFDGDGPILQSYQQDAHNTYNGNSKREHDSEELSCNGNIYENDGEITGGLLFMMKKVCVARCFLDFH